MEVSGLVCCMSRVLQYIPSELVADGTTAGVVAATAVAVAVAVVAAA